MLSSTNTLMTESSPENFSQFEKLLVDLARAEVDFAVVGGVAVSLNGFVRATDDLDILVQEAPETCGGRLIAYPPEVKAGHES
jgi:hypothetical protein